MYIFSVEDAQRDLPRILEMVAEGKEVAIGGKHPALLRGVWSVANFGDGNPESCGSIIVGLADDSVAEDELVKPMPDDEIEAFYKPRIYDATPSPVSR
jgi:hypothetical protein